VHDRCVKPLDRRVVVLVDDADILQIERATSALARERRKAEAHVFVQARYDLEHAGAQGIPEHVVPHARRAIDQDEHGRDLGGECDLQTLASIGVAVVAVTTKLPPTPLRKSGPVVLVTVAPSLEVVAPAPVTALVIVLEPALVMGFGVTRSTRTGWAGNRVPRTGAAGVGRAAWSGLLLHGFGRAAVQEGREREAADE
jgi:hypothetical protein